MTPTDAIPVLHVFCGPFPLARGTQTLVRQTADLAHASPFHCALACYAFGDDAPQTVPLHRLPLTLGFRSRRSGPRARKLLLILAMAAHVRRLLREHRIRLLHAHHYEALLACRLADPGARVPLLFHQHAEFAPELPLYLPRIAPLAALAGHFSDAALPHLATHTICLSNDAQQRLVRSGIPKTRTTVLRPPTTEVRPHQPAPHPPGAPRHLAYIGNLDPYQGLDNLVRAAAALPTAHRDNVRFLIITDDAPARLAPLLRTHNLSDRFAFVPHGSYDYAQRALDRACALVVPRHHPGGIPIKLVGALAAGRPCLTDARLCDFLRPDTEALLVPMNRPHDVAVAMMRLLESASLRRALSQGARQAAQRLFCPQGYQRDILALYRRLLAHPTRPQRR